MEAALLDVRSHWEAPEKTAISETLAMLPLQQATGMSYGFKYRPSMCNKEYGILYLQAMQWEMSGRYGCKHARSSVRTFAPAVCRHHASDSKQVCGVASLLALLGAFCESVLFIKCIVHSITLYR